MYQLDTKKYPWLISKYESWDSEGRPEIEEYEVLDSLPEGWLVSFGDLMCADLDEVIRRDHLFEFRFDEAKEKWGAMRIYSSGGNDATEDIIDGYSHLSENICILCGKPDVYMTNNGWLFPCCKDCWEKNKSHPSYEQAISKEDSGKMADTYGYIRYQNDKKKEYTFDISATADKIRKHWNEITEQE